MTERKRSAAFKDASQRWKALKLGFPKQEKDPECQQDTLHDIHVEETVSSCGLLGSPTNSTANMGSRPSTKLNSGLVDPSEVIVVSSEGEVDDTEELLLKYESPILVLENPTLNDSGNKRKPCVSMEHLLGSPYLQETFQFNFNVELEYALSFFHPNVSQLKRKITFITGSSILACEESSILKQRFNVSEIVAALPNVYASHHTKMMINIYPKSLEIVIMTCNLTKLDICGLSQMIWKSGKLDKLESSSIASLTHSSFKVDMQLYLKKYKSSVLTALSVKLDEYDFSNVTVELVASAPGIYDMSQPAKNGGLFGYGKLRELLTRHDFLVRPLERPTNFLGQVSSIAYPFYTCKGNVSSVFTHILCPLITQSSTKEFALLKAGAELCKIHQEEHCYIPHLIFPSAAEVAKSHAGFSSGQAIHFNYTKSATHRAQYFQTVKPYLKRYMSQYSLGPTHRPVMPHLKIMLCDNNDEWHSLKWVYIGSHNLSKQAWGMPLNPKLLKLLVYRVDSFELGVMIFPPHGKLLVPWIETDMHANEIGVALPFSLPPTPYSNDDEPWSMHRSFPGLVDRFGSEYIVD